MAAKVKFNTGAATLPAADGRREARGEFTGWQTRSARPLRRADGIFLSSNPFPMKPPRLLSQQQVQLVRRSLYDRGANGRGEKREEGKKILRGDE